MVVWHPRTMLLATLARRWHAGRTPAPAGVAPARQPTCCGSATRCCSSSPCRGSGRGSSTLAPGPPTSASRSALTLVFLGSYVVRGRDPSSGAMRRRALRWCAASGSGSCVRHDAGRARGRPAIDATARPDRWCAAHRAVVVADSADGAVDVHHDLAAAWPSSRWWSPVRWLGSRTHVGRTVDADASSPWCWCGRSAPPTTSGSEQYDRPFVGAGRGDQHVGRGVPMIVTASPAGSVVSQVALHVTVVLRGLRNRRRSCRPAGRWCASTNRPAIVPTIPEPDPERFNFPS